MFDDFFFNFSRENKIKTEDKNITLKKENVNRELNSHKDGYEKYMGKIYTISTFSYLVIISSSDPKGQGELLLP